MTTLSHQQPFTAITSVPNFDVCDRALHQTAQRLRSLGADDATIRLCLGMSALDKIIAENRGRKSHVFFASFPKSGTTYLHRLLLDATGFPDYLIDRFSEDQQQNIIRQWMPMFLAQDSVTQIHMFATAPNTRMMKELGVRPAVLIRQLPDVLISLRDHVITEDKVVPLAQFPAEFRDWSTDEQHWFLVRMVTPWYLNFYASWMRAEKSLDVLWVRYEELVMDPRRVVESVLKHSEVGADAARVSRAIDAVDMTKVRFNVGAAGRGRQSLSESQLQTMQRIAATFRGTIDFTAIGL